MDKTTIVVIDEQQMYRAGVRQALSRCPGFDVQECAPSDDVLKLIETTRPEVVLLGCRLTVHGSLGLAESIARHFPSTPVIILSPNPDDEGLFEVIKTSAVACVEKSASASELVDTIRRAYDGEYPIGDAVMARRGVAGHILSQFDQNAFEGKTGIGTVVAPLSSRETQVLTCVANGNTNKQIGAALHISEQTIKNHMSAVLRKLSANDRAHAVVVAARHGWISLQPDDAGEQLALAGVK